MRFADLESLGSRWGAPEGRLHPSSATGAPGGVPRGGALPRSELSSARRLSVRMQIQEPSQVAHRRARRWARLHRAADGLAPTELVPILIEGRDATIGPRCAAEYHSSPNEPRLCSEAPQLSLGARRRPLARAVGRVVRARPRRLARAGREALRARPDDLLQLRVG